MNIMRYIFVGLDGPMAFGLMLLVRSKTGVQYGVQCGEGHYLRIAEGYLVPLGDDRDAAVLRNLFVRFPYGFDSQESLRLLHEAVSTYTVRVVNASYDISEAAELDVDEERLDEALDGWIPVHSAYGGGFLIYQTS